MGPSIRAAKVKGTHISKIKCHSENIHFCFSSVAVLRDCLISGKMKISQLLLNQLLIISLSYSYRQQLLIRSFSNSFCLQFLVTALKQLLIRAFLILYCYLVSYGKETLHFQLSPRLAGAGPLKYPRFHGLFLSHTLILPFEFSL